MTPEGPSPMSVARACPIDPDANFPSRAFLQKTIAASAGLVADRPAGTRTQSPAKGGGINSALYLPLLREGECIGVLRWSGSRPNIFGPGEIAQAESFRDQALIAIENARLFNETQEALERQTATAEVLKVIASSPSDVQPVFDAIAASANRLLGGFSTTVIRFVGDALHLVAFTPTNADGGRSPAGGVPETASPTSRLSCWFATARPSSSSTPRRNWACRRSSGNWRDCAAIAACCSRR